MTHYVHTGIVRDRAARQASRYDRKNGAVLLSYPTIYIIATEIAGNYLFPWKDVNWLTCSIIYTEVIGENIKNIK